LVILIFFERDDGSISGTVKSVSYLGSRVDYMVDINGIDVSVSLDTREIRHIGDCIRLSIDGEGIWVVEDKAEIIPGDNGNVKKKKRFLSIRWK